MSVPHDRDLRLRSGRIRIRCRGGEERIDRVVVCIPGLSSNLAVFDLLASSLSSPATMVVAVDLRGRGASEVTPEGTYGWRAHAADVTEIGASFGAASIDLIGHSMGAYVATQVAVDDPAAVDRLVLIDGVGVPERGALELISAGLGRLDRWHRSEATFVEAVRSTGLVAPWHELWDSHYRYELERGPDGRVRSTTSLVAAEEDLRYGEDHPHDALWGGLRGPVLLVRAGLPLGDSRGFVVPTADAERFHAIVPGAEVVEVEANHFGVMADPATTSAVAHFLADGHSPTGEH